MKKFFFSLALVVVMSGHFVLAEQVTHLLDCWPRYATSEEAARNFEFELSLYESPAISLVPILVLLSRVGSGRLVIPEIIRSEWLVYDQGYLEIDSSMDWLEQFRVMTYRFVRSDAAQIGQLDGYWLVLKGGEIVRDSREIWTEEDKNNFELFSKAVFMCERKEIRR